MQKYKILIVDDEKDLLQDFKEYLTDYHLSTFFDPEEALQALQKEFHDVLIVDYRMPKVSGLEFLLRAKKSQLYSYGILLTAYADKALLERVINNQLIHKFIEKPVSLQQLKTIIDEALAVCKRKREKQKALKNIKMHYEYLKQEQELMRHDLVGRSEGLQEVYTKIKAAARYPVNVLLLGETGTGKELAANMIHELSERRNDNFIKLNCAAIPENLIESELFGYSKGAFTGANSSKPGKIEMANGGTLFLDEVGEMHKDMQVKLLRVLQHKEVERLGSNTPIKVDFRLITATNKDIEDCVKGGKFREDFYFRINAFPIRLPPLRERKSDIPALVDHLVEKTCRELNMKQPQIGQPVYGKLQSYSWPGNVRELENAIMRALIIASGRAVLREEDFEFIFHNTANNPIPIEKAIELLRDEILEKKLEVKEIEKYLLKSILDFYHGDIKVAVKHTAISKDRFYRLKRSDDVTRKTK